MQEAPAPSATTTRPARLAWLITLVRAEDWLLGGWVIIASPVLAHFESNAGPFDPNQPLDGAFRLLAVVGALICLVTGRSDAPDGASRSIQIGAATGPLTGGLLLVAVSGATGLGLSGALPTAALVVAVVLVIAVRLRWPALPTAVRRALVTPFVLAAAGIYWNIVDSITGGNSLVIQTGGADLQTIGAVIGVLLAFSAVYYAMLVYAPRQVAEPEGSPQAWLARYGLFAASTILGLGWLRIFGL